MTRLAGFLLIVFGGAGLMYAAWHRGGKTALQHWARYVIGGVIMLLLVFVVRPVPELPKELRLGSIVPVKVYAAALEDVSTRSGIEKLTRKDVKATSHAAAPGAAASFVERFVAAAADNQLAVAVDSVMGTREDSSAVQPESVSRATPRDTVCVGAGGSVRKRELVLLSACAPGNAGTIDRFHGSSFDWSYDSGHAKVSITRLPDVMEWVWRALSAVFGYFAGKAF